MKTKFILACTVAFATTIGAHAQQETEQSQIVVASSPQDATWAISRFPGNEAAQEWREALKAYADAESASDKKELEGKISDMLGEQYDSALDRYDMQIEEMEKRLEEMRDQVKRRRAARDEMVDLKLQMILSEAEGLGWPGDNRGDLRIGVPFDATGFFGGSPGPINVQTIREATDLAPLPPVPGVPVRPRRGK